MGLCSCQLYLLADNQEQIHKNILIREATQLKVV